MVVGIVGLGLIGGSLAKAYKRRPGITVLGSDRDKSVVDFAQIAQALDGHLTEENMATCDIILLATYPQGVIDWVKNNGANIKASTLVVDCSGSKERICRECFPLAKEFGFSFVGGHPMAGTHYSGFKYSREDMFDGSPMVIVPPDFTDIALMDKAKSLLAPVGFGRISATSSVEHDEIIAFTSQMAHIISNGYIKSPTALRHRGFSAGSYKDLTRVAWLNPEMWSELFLENKDALLGELDIFLSAMHEYRDALEAENGEQLTQLLRDGRVRKEEVDGI